MTIPDRQELLVRHLTRFLGRLADSDDPAAAEALGRLIRQTAEGHIALSLDDTVDSTVLRESGLLGTAGQHRPLVLDTGNRLYLYRYWDYERRVAASLIERAGTALSPSPGILKKHLDALFPDPLEALQKRAAATAALRRLTVVTGGPGTGKTTVVVKILTLLLQLQPGLRIALAAPTGKAAMRVGEALRAAGKRLQLEPELWRQIPQDAATLHRLLRLYPGTGRFCHENRLPFDVVVIDEASMIGVGLMAQLLEAIPDHGRLLLLGDKDQLASVEPGAVLGDICDGVSSATPAFNDQLARVGVRSEGSRERHHALQDNIVTLTHSFRFGDDSGIGQLADAIRRGDADAALSLLRDPAKSTIELHEATDVHEQQELLLPWLEARLQNYLAAFNNSTMQEQILADFESFRLLCALRRGITGVTGLNAFAERLLADAGLIDNRDPWYPGRPVMVTHNDYQLQLFNGDIGITVLEQGVPRVIFTTAEGTRLLHTPRLPEHETVFAMTVHKSQGSEFDDVALMLPAEDTQVLTRELVYTAVTRARRRVRIVGNGAILSAAIARSSERTSGLSTRLLTDERTQPRQGRLF